MSKAWQDGYDAYNAVGSCSPCACPYAAPPGSASEVEWRAWLTGWAVARAVHQDERESYDDE